MTSVGVRHLAAGVGRNGSLRSLWLFANAAGDEGAAHLAAALRNSSLLHLGLELNEVTTTGAEALAFALSLEGCALQWLRLQHNAIGDGGVSALARSLYTNRSLTKLQLRDTAVGAAGCAVLAKALPQHRALQALGLEENYLPPAATEGLLRAMRQSSSLASLSLDLQHGGDYTKPRTSTEMMAEFTLTMSARCMRRLARRAASHPAPPPPPPPPPLPAAARASATRLPLARWCRRHQCGHR